MRRALFVIVAVVLASLSLTSVADAQDAQIGEVTADPATVPEAGEYTFSANGTGFIPDTSIIVLKCVSPADELVPGVSDLETIVAAAGEISPLEDCDVAAAQNIDVDGDGAWTAELTAEVGPNFFLSAGALDGSQAGATWIAIVPEGAGEAAEEEAAEEEAAEEEAAEDEPEADAALADTGVETGLLAVVGAAVLGAGALALREGRRFRQ